MLIHAACLLLMALLPTGARPAAAQAAGTPRTLVLSLAETRRLALAQAPGFLAERQEAAIAKGELRQTRLYAFNPELELSAPGSATDRGLGEYEARLTQEVEWAGQRGLRIRAARLGATGADAGVRDAARRTLRDASNAFYAAVVAQEKAGVANEILELTTQLFGAARTQLAAGEISALDANLAGIEYGRARARVLTAERELVAVRLDLQRRLGLNPDDSVSLVLDTLAVPDPAGLDADSLTRLALDNRPDLVAQRANADRARAELGLAAREAIPNLRIGVVAERTALDLAPALPGTPAQAAFQTPRVGLVVSLPVPLWNLNQGLKDERRARLAQAGFALQATEIDVRTEVETAVRVYRAAREEAQVFEREVLAPAHENQRLLERAFQAGKLGLTDLILLRNQLLDAELGYWDAWLAEHQALVDVEAATAAILGDEPIMGTNALEAVR